MNRPPTRPRRVLIVDDSALLRRALRATFEQDRGFVVAGEAATGRDAITKAGELRPDLITMDLDMPDMDGLLAIEQIMSDHPTPILVVTGVPRFRGMDAQFEALTRGAIELVPKPSAFPGTPAEQRFLLDLARMVTSVPVVPHVRGASQRRRDARAARPTSPGVARALPHPTPAGPATASSVVVVGASTGGPGAIRELLVDLGNDVRAPLVIVQHMTDIFAEGFIEWLGGQARVRVVEAVPGLRIRPQTVYVAVRGPHMRVSAEGLLEAAPQASGAHCPAVDVLFESAARSYGARALGVLLTGMGDDGADGMAAIAAAGGHTIAQDEASCTVFGMPKAAIDRGAARVVAPLGEIARLIREACTGPNADLVRGGTTHVK